MSYATQLLSRYNDLQRQRTYNENYRPERYQEVNESYKSYETDEEILRAERALYGKFRLKDGLRFL